MQFTTIILHSEYLTAYIYQSNEKNYIKNVRTYKQKAKHNPQIQHNLLTAAGTLGFC